MPGRRTLRTILVVLVLLSPLAAAGADDGKKARGENTQGLRDHARKRYAAALKHFEAAVALDPSFTTARYNAACAASLGGDVPAAKGHADLWLAAVPDAGARLLNDPDLAALRADAAFMAGLRAHLRPAARSVRTIVFERREKGGDLFAVGDDGLDERPIAVDPDAIEYDATFADGGRRLLYLSSRKGPKRVIFDYKGAGGARFLHEPDDVLMSMPFPGGPAVVLAERVHAWQLSPDGAFALVVDRETDAHTASAPLRVRRVPVGGGTAELLGPVDTGSVSWCVSPSAGGSWLVVDGVPRDSWMTGLDVRLTRLKAGVTTSVLEPVRPTHKEPRLYGFPACVSADGGNTLHLGTALATVDPPKLTWIPGLDVGLGTYRDRRPLERAGIGSGARPDVYLTVYGERVDGFDETTDKEVPPPAAWRVSPLSEPQQDGRGPGAWMRTRVVKVGWDGEITPVTASDTYLEYGVAVASDGALAVTRVSSDKATPWVVVTEPGATRGRPVVPGQYPRFAPTPRRVPAAGDSLWGDTPAK